MVQSVGAPWRKGWGEGSWLAGLHWKSVLTGELFAVSRTWLPWEGQSQLGQPGPGCQGMKYRS